METAVQPITKAQRDALFAKMFAGVQPADQRPQSITATLRPYRRQLIAKRREGYSLRQIAEQLKVGPLACEVSPAMLKVLIAGPAAKRRAKMKKMAAQYAARIAAAGTASAATNTVRPQPTAK